MNEEQEMTPKVEVAPLQSKTLKFFWLMTTRDWTNEIVIIGVLILAAMDLRYAHIVKESAQLASAIGGGLVGYLVRGAKQDIPEVG